MYIYIHIYIYILYILYVMHLSFQIKDHFRLMHPMLEPSVRHNSTIFPRFIKTYIKKNYDLQFHFSTLTFSFFITFILNYAIFNLQLFRMGLFGAFHWWVGNILWHASHISCNDETSHSYTLWMIHIWRPIFQFSRSLTLVKFFHPLDNGRPISNKLSPSPNDGQSIKRKHTPRMTIICY